MSKKDKAQVHSGFTSGVYNADASGCIALGGILKKKNSHGVWQKRYFYLNNEFLIYKKDHSATDIKGAVDVGDIADFRASNKGDLTIHMNGGETLELKGSDSREIGNWIAAMEERREWVLSERELLKQAAEEVSAGTSNGGGSDGPVMITKAGWLMKKSNNKYGGMQERYVKLSNNFFRYFKHSVDAEKDIAALGSVSLETADWVRPYDSADDCKTFELQAQSRVYLFTAESPADMKAWISAVDQAITCAKTILDNVAKAREVAATPYRVRIYDEKGADALAEVVEADLEDIYPFPVPVGPKPQGAEDDEEGGEVEGGERVAAVEDHISLAWQVVDYIEDLLPDVAKVTGRKQRAARLDVLAVCLLKINSFLSGRLTPVMNPDLMDTRKMQLGDVHAAINWLNNYQQLMRNIYCPPLIPDSPNPTTFRLFEEIPALCEMYVKGAEGLQGAQTFLISHSNKVWESFVKDPMEAVESRQDGTFYTHAPTDMWELFHHHLSLATATNSPVLCFMVAETIVSAVMSIIGNIKEYVESMNDPKNTGSFRDIELELLCALANDAALHFEELENVVEKFELDEIKKKVDALFDLVGNNLKHCGQACLRRLSALIMEDIGDHLQEIWTPTWLGTPPPIEPPTKPSNQISIVMATINDYLVDMKDYLDEMWLERLNNCVLEALVTRYFKSVMKIEQVANSPTKTPEGRKRVSTFLGTSAKGVKSMVDKITVTVLRVDEISLSLLDNDRNAIIQYFAPKTPKYADYVAVLDDLSAMLVDDSDDLGRLLMSRINQCPPAAQAIIEAANRCVAMRDDMADEDKEMMFASFAPILKAHSELVGSSDVVTVSADNRVICALYCNVGLQPKKSLSTKLLNMTYRQVSRGASLHDIAPPPPMEEDKMVQYRDSDVGRLSNVDDVLHVLKTDDAEYLELLKAEEEAAQQAMEAEQQAIAAGRAALNLEGLMEKKSPAHNLWQARWFKLMTRVNESETGGFTYTHTILWYKKKGGSVTKALDAKGICCMQLLSSPRSLAYLTDDFNVHLAHDPVGMRGVPVKEWDVEADSTAGGDVRNRITQGHGQTYSFMLQLDSSEVHGGSKKGSGAGDKDVILRVDSVDTLIKWMNAIGAASKLEYDIPSGVWIKGDRKKKINPKAILKASSVPQEGTHSKVIPRSMSVMPTSTSSSAASLHTHTSLLPMDSFEEQLLAEDDEDEGGETDEGNGEPESPANRTALHLEGQLEKKSPAHNLWQARWFKMTTRVGDSNEGTRTSYTLHWYKKRGGSALKSIDADSIGSMSLLCSARPVLYSADDYNIHVLIGDAQLQKGVAVHETGAETSGCCFLLSIEGTEVKAGKKEKDVILRAETVEKMVNWMNCIADAASLQYNSMDGVWRKGDRTRKNNPKAFTKSSTMPIPTERSKAEVFNRSASTAATLTGSSKAATLSSIEDEDEGEGEEDMQVDQEYDDHEAQRVGERALSNESADSVRSSSSYSDDAGTPSFSPKKMVLTRSEEAQRQSSGSPSPVDQASPSRGGGEGVNGMDTADGAHSPLHSPTDGATHSPAEHDDEEGDASIDMSQIIVPVANEPGNTERDSDIYSMHDDDIPEHNEHDDDDDALVGDGSKPVGCTSCIIM